jgi:hypothetical protein
MGVVAAANVSFEIDFNTYTLTLHISVVLVLNTQ